MSIYGRSLFTVLGELVALLKSTILLWQCTLLALVCTNNTEQLTPAVGILGAVAGYLFGSAKTHKEESLPAEPAADGHRTDPGK
jgi:hypothetical protein